MLDSTRENQPEDLMLETVSDDELRIILERLGQQEFGGDPATTVQDVVEGTGADPIVIGRILAEIRKEAFEKRFRLQLNRQEQRIDDHEDRIEGIEKREKKLLDSVGWLQYAVTHKGQSDSNRVQANPGPPPLQVQARPTTPSFPTEYPDKFLSVVGKPVVSTFNQRAVRSDVHPELLRLRAEAEVRRERTRAAGIFWKVMMAIGIMFLIWSLAPTCR